ncbi:MAG: hypothetical protein ACFFEF_12770 [Candidatus Thorarchaeota archaeon]
MRKISVIVEKTEYNAGDTVSGIAQIICDKAFDFNAMYISFICREHTLVTKQVGKYTHVYTEDYFHANEKLTIREPGKLEEGEISVPFSFAIPEDAPSSYKGERANIEYFLEGRIEISWAKDPIETVNLVVHGSSNRANPQTQSGLEEDDGVVVLEAEVENNEVCCGDHIKARYRVSREFEKMRGIRVDLQANETAVAKGYKAELRRRVASEFVENERITKGSWMSIEIPTVSAPYTYTGPLISVEVLLKVVIDIPRGFDREIAIPISILRCNEYDSSSSSRETSSDLMFQ